MEEILKELERIKDALQILQISMVFTATCGKYQNTEVHIREEDFRKNFTHYETRERSSSEYPLEMFYILNGVKFYALVRATRKEL